MRAPLSWLREYVDIDLPVEELAERLTLAGLEVKAIDRIGDWWDRERIVVGRVVRVEPHPNADRLTLPVVEYGNNEAIQVVTGAPNVAVGSSGQKVALAMAGARLIDGYAEERRWITLKPSRIRGVASEGMVCSEKELGLSDEHEGILILPDDAPVGVPLVDYLGDMVLDIELTPNLARCLSIIGVAREVAALTGRELRLTEPEMLAQGPPAAGQVSVEIADPDLCSRYTATIIRGIEVSESPFWMRRRLQLCGVRPINNIVDITNYVMLEWGQPLHAFDYDLLRGPSGRRPPEDTPCIVVRRARPGETMTTLDGQLRQLDEDILLITDGGGPVAVAGVMGGLESEIGEATRHVLLEAASFDMIGNRVAAQRLRLSSEAAYRFGRGVPPSLADRAARRAAELMRSLAGGEIQAGVVDAYPVPQPVIVVPLNPERARRVLGLDVSDDEIEAILCSLEFRVQRANEEWRVEVPPERLDVSIEEDLYEEIARLYGYERLPTTRMRDELPPEHDDRSLRAEEVLRNALVASGLQEVITYSLVDWRQELPLHPAGALTEDDYVRVLNPLATDRQWLRRLVLPGVLGTVRDNLRFTDALRIFEIGHVYLHRQGQELPEERARLAAAMTGWAEEPSWQDQSPRGLDFFDAKGALEEVAQRLGVSLSFSAGTREGMHPGRTANVSLEDGTEIGYLAELHPATRAFYGLPEQPIMVWELDLVPLLEHWVEHPKVEPVSRFPPVIQDMAVVLPIEVPEALVEEEILRAGGALLGSARLFDIYTGDPIPEGERSLAFRLVYRALDRTPGEDEVRRAHERIARRLAERLGARLRE
ncbi:MAG: phenylalanine--tRNA ligase subunit beta [Anaerolineae bacterium]|nr:phenylalanine--tRNA ligase subunit beta [Anaerolineae bacterium]